MPWITSVEMEYPRYLGKVPRSAVDDAFDRMASEECRLLMPLSEAARRHFLSRLGGRHLRAVQQKTQVFTGGVYVPDALLRLREDHLRARASDPFRVIFVGRLFWHKGGPAVLQAVERLRAKGLNVVLTVVSDLRPVSHVVRVDPAEAEAMRAWLRTSPWIEYHESLPNTEVLALMAGSEVLAFPTLDESLGWVVIEAMALSLPIITTNIFALPEMVTDGVEGFVIDVPRDGDGRWTGIESLNKPPRPSYNEAIERLADGCIAALERLIERPDERLAMGRAGRTRYLAQYAADVAALRLAGLVRGHL
jgi:glycosyltransferase involved in cell wall biosynthesis